MASRATAGFTLPNGPGLGVADTGQPWVQLRGAAEIKSGRAYFPASNPGALWVVNTGLGGGDATVSCRIVPHNGGGQALYFRVIDVNHWWRLSKRKYTYSYTYQSGTTDPIYGWKGNGTYYYEPAGDFVYKTTSRVSPGSFGYGTTQTVFASFDSRVGVHLSKAVYYTNAGETSVDHYIVRTVYENQVYTQIGGGEPIYSTGYATAVNVVLEKCVNGSVSRFKEASGNDSMAEMSVVLDKESISCFVDGVALWPKFIDGTHKEAFRHGIGYSEATSESNSAGIESFDALPFVLSGYMPPLML